jgi:hypothetical protein
MVFCGIFPTDGQPVPDLRDALDKLQLNDAPSPSSPRLRGARLRLPLRLPRPAAHGDRPGAPRARVQPRPHHHRAQRRLQASTTDGERCIFVREPGSRLPDPMKIEHRGAFFTVHHPRDPDDYVGAVIKLCQERRGEQKAIQYASAERVIITYELPLAEVLFDFFDKLKSDHARLRLDGLRAAGLPRERAREARHADQRREGRRPVDHRAPDKAYHAAAARGEAEGIDPPQQFEVAIQAAIGGKIIARETVRKALRKDVTRQVLRRRHQPQAQAAREAERGQEAHEVGRRRRDARRDPAGRLRERPAARSARSRSSGPWCSRTRPRRRRGARGSRRRRGSRDAGVSSPVAARSAPGVASQPRRGAPRRILSPSFSSLLSERGLRLRADRSSCARSALLLRRCRACAGRVRPRPARAPPRGARRGPRPRPPRGAGACW